MDERHERAINERWPDWFDVGGGPSVTGMVFGFQHGNGWLGLVYQLCEDLEPLVEGPNAKLAPAGEHFRVLGVKQKLGALRFCISHHTESIDAVIERARLRSLQTCEVCSRLIRTVALRDHNGWLVTWCENCEQDFRRDRARQEI